MFIFILNTYINNRKLLFIESLYIEYSSWKIQRSLYKKKELLHQRFLIYIHMLRRDLFLIIALSCDLKTSMIDVIGFFERTCEQEKPGSQEIESRVVLESKSVQREEKFREKNLLFQRNYASSNETPLENRKLIIIIYVYHTHT